MMSVIHLIFLLAFFTLLGLSVASEKTVKSRLALLPTLGFGALIGLSYIISANLKIAGALAVTYATLILLSLVFLRLPKLGRALSTVSLKSELLFSLFIALIPMATLMLPAILYGFNYFYGDVNFDFFYNSQDAWFLKTHHVLELKAANGEDIIPLSWSSNFQGRFGVSLLGAFFSYWLQWDALQFNSLLLNTLVVLFALSMSVFCATFFNFTKKSLVAAVVFSLSSAAFVQGYSYYLLGQLSAIPVFVVYCIILKDLLDGVTRNQTIALSPLNKNTWALALLFNVLYILYAILGFFALFLTGVSGLLCCYSANRKRVLLALIPTLLLAAIVFWVARLLAIPESVSVIQDWVMTSTKVAAGSQVIIVFSEYLKDAFLSLLFGIVNYPSTTSIFRVLPVFIPKNYLFFLLGLAALATFLLALKTYISSAKENSLSARSIIAALALIVLSTVSYFFYSLAPYGIFKIQTWFMPLLMPLFIYAFNKKVKFGKIEISLSLYCGILLTLNLAASIIYITDFVTPDINKHFANVRGITGNKDINDLAAALQAKHIKQVSLHLPNGIESAWVANFIRSIPIIDVTQNLQPLAAKELIGQGCENINEKNLSRETYWVMVNPNSDRRDITDAPTDGKVVYENESYQVLDPARIHSMVYIGRGAYPVELNVAKNTQFPRRFRWVEKGVEVVVYSDEARIANLLLEVTPGYVQTAQTTRHLSIKTNTKRYDFSVTGTTMLTVPNVALHKGLTCFLLESEDAVTQPRSVYGILRPGITLDSRVLNFAVSYVAIK